ncbi:MAG: hypothetical protein KAH32_06735 [Chlamydiia bacterium]|nr:hypothetical protein [Chlamydiia bacterium]
MKLKIITYIFYKFLILYIKEIGADKATIDIKVAIFNNEYSKFAADGTAQEEYDRYRIAARKGTTKDFASNELFRQLRKEKSWKYAKLMSIVNKYSIN